MSWALHLLAIVLAVFALCGNYSCGKSDNISRSFWFDLAGGVAIALAYTAGKVA